MRVSSPEVILNVTRCVKFGRLSMDGGMTMENLDVLISQTSEIIQRLGTCSRLVKTIMPLQKKE